MKKQASRLLLAAFLFAAFAAGAAIAQVPEIRLARQFSMGYLQFNVMEHQQLIEKIGRASCRERV